MEPPVHQTLIMWRIARSYRRPFRERLFSYLFRCSCPVGFSSRGSWSVHRPLRPTHVSCLFLPDERPPPCGTPCLRKGSWRGLWIDHRHRRSKAELKSTLYFESFVVRQAPQRTRTDGMEMSWLERWKSGRSLWKWSIDRLEERMAVGSGSLSNPIVAFLKWKMMQMIKKISSQCIILSLNFYFI